MSAQMLKRLVQSVLAAFFVVGATSNSALYFVDVSPILCESQSQVQIEIPLDAIPTDQRSDPHILTLFRTFTDSVSLQYSLTDSSSPENRTLDAANVTLRSLNASSSRRLHDADVESHGLVEAIPRTGPGGPDMHANEMVDGDEDAGGRRLHGGFRRRRASSFSSPRRRSSPATGPAASPTTGAGTWGQSRRRAPTSAAQAAGLAAPASSWGSQHVNSYHYPSSAALSHNYGGRQPVSTGYGYSGAGAYHGNSGTQIAMAAGAGALAGVGASYAWSRLPHFMGSFVEECSAGDQHYKNCAECRSKHTPASDCAGSFTLTLKADLARDDLMTSGFVPSNITGPLRLIITDVLGADFTPERLCPPSNWTDNVTSGNASGDISGNFSENFSAIFATLTRLATAPAVEEQEDAAGVAHNHSVVHFVLIAAVVTCCCVGCCVAGGMFKQRSGSEDPCKHGAQVQFPAHGPVAQLSAAQLPAAQFQQPYPAASQHGYPQCAAAEYRPGLPAAMQVPAYQTFH
mmetsp:Transcript_120006/g.299333  ORF Transcript_120006/g.299333 Transcript_120006/m.299333 type:complete len:516 (-) Transcript_120006:334-1881(-)